MYIIIVVYNLNYNLLFFSNFYSIRHNRLKCTVWDEHVDTVLPYFNDVIEGPLVVLIQLGRVKTINGIVK